MAARSLAVALCALLALPPRLWSAGSRSLADLSIEELMNESVTSVSKKETKLAASPAAISVVTPDDLRRLGITTLPDALRLVPGMDVGQIDGHQWAVSTRGFNHQFAGRLLVLIDGRTVYTPASAGVFWSAQDVVFEDLDRIEVIRGPGATMWGSNAVNGVINITTKSARETQGGMITTVVGSGDAKEGTVRYGGEIAPDAHYRVYVKKFRRAAFDEPEAAGMSIRDWEALRAGFRADWEPSTAHDLTLQGEIYEAHTGTFTHALSFNPPRSFPLAASGHDGGSNLLGRWKHAYSFGSEATFQAFYDHVRQSDGFTVEYRDTYDADLQHRFAFGERHEVVWGAGYRRAALHHTSSSNVLWTPEHARLELANFFVQDEVKLVPDRLHVTGGTKIEHNNLTGLELQPSARAIWMPSPGQSLWAAFSRATRTPSFFERNGRVNVAAFQPQPTGPLMVVSMLGNPQAGSEKLTSREIGYRIEVNRRLSFDLAAFHNDYQRLLSPVDRPPAFEANAPAPHLLISSAFENSQRAETAGGELSAHWQPTSHWWLAGSYSYFRLHQRPDSGPEHDSPMHQFQLRSFLDLPGRTELNAAGYYVDDVTPVAGGTRVRMSDYVRIDVGVTWRPWSGMELGVFGQNLLQAHHFEFPSEQSGHVTPVPRTFGARATWRF